MTMAQRGSTAVNRTVSTNKNTRIKFALSYVYKAAAQGRAKRRAVAFDLTAAVATADSLHNLNKFTPRQLSQMGPQDGAAVQQKYGHMRAYPWSTTLYLW